MPDPEISEGGRAPPKRTASSRQRQSPDYDITSKPDGRLLSEKYELSALALADEVPKKIAWRVPRGEHSRMGQDWKRGSDSYQRDVFNTPTFIERVRVLSEERAEVLKDPVFGDAKWAAMMTYRVAREVNDVPTMVKAADLLFKIASAQGDTSTDDEVVERRKEGKPSNPTATSTAKGDALRAKLAAMK